MTRVAILQSNYIPWRGYFDLIRQVDHFVFYDEVQYTKNDWRNRNIIVPATGQKWLTLPIDTSGKSGQTIAEARIKDHTWAAKHCETLCQVYRRANHADEWVPQIKMLYDRLQGETRLSVVNQTIIRQISSWLGLETEFHDSCDLTGHAQGKTARLVGIVQALGGQDYVSGPAARTYLNTDLFQDAGLTLSWMSYPDYPAYRQLDGDYRSGVSILDTLLNTGLADLFSVPNTS